MKCKNKTEIEEEEFDYASCLESIFECIIKSRQSQRLNKTECFLVESLVSDKYGVRAIPLFGEACNFLKVRDEEETTFKMALTFSTSALSKEQTIIELWEIRLLKKGIFCFLSREVILKRVKEFKEELESFVSKGPITTLMENDIYLDYDINTKESSELFSDTIIESSSVKLDFGGMEIEIKNSFSKQRIEAVNSEYKATSFSSPLHRSSFQKKLIHSFKHTIAPFKTLDLGKSRHSEEEKQIILATLPQAKSNKNSPQIQLDENYFDIQKKEEELRKALADDGLMKEYPVSEFYKSAKLISRRIDMEKQPIAAFESLESVFYELLQTIESLHKELGEEAL